MTESMIVEAVRAAGGAASASPAAGVAGGPQPVGAVADPAAVARFEAAMAAGGPSSVSAVQPADPIPFVSEVSAAWRSAQINNQGILHRIRALSELGRSHGPSAADMIELQYEVANLAFQQEVVTKVADKSSTAIQTLIKNQ